MKWPLRLDRKRELEDALRTHSRTVCPMPGIVDARALDTFVMQLIASLRREDYFRLVQRGPVPARRANPNDPSFQAELGVAHLLQHGDIDEASWLVFLMTYFAKPAETGWTRLRDVYGRLGDGIWNWSTVSADPQAFGAWLATNWRNIRGTFGSHRKYESLRPDARRPMSTAVRSYVTWVTEAGGHQQLFANSVRNAGNDPHVIFDALYRDIPVPGFGRLARFDFVAMLGRYNIVPVEAGSAYLVGATGPTSGAKLLFDGQRHSPTSVNSLQRSLDMLDMDLKVGMQVLEDALCNWQKHPLDFVHFRG